MPTHTIPAQLIDEPDYRLLMTRDRVEDAGSMNPRQLWLYAFGREGEAPLLHGCQFDSPIGMDDRSAMLNLMGFLTLRPGDTDAEFFDRHSPLAMEWAKSYSCEALGAWVLTEEERATA